MFTDDPTRPLDGPGRFWRWCAALPLLLLAFFGIPVALYLTVSWANYLHFRLFQDSWLPDPEELPRLLAPFGGVVTVTVLLLVLFRHIPLVWPRLSLIMSAPPAFMSLITSDFYPNGTRPGPVVRILVETPFLSGGLGLAAAWATTHLAIRILTRPWATDVVDGRLELTTRLRTSGRLRLRRGRLILDRLSFGGGRPPEVGTGKLSTKVPQLGIPLSSLHRVEIGRLTESSAFTLPNGATIPLTPGPALWITGTHQQWVLPVADATRVAEAVNRRAATATDRATTFVSGAYGYLTVALVGSGAAVASLGMVANGGSPSFLGGALFYAVIGATAFPAYFRALRKIRALQDEPPAAATARPTVPGWLGPS